MKDFSEFLKLINGNPIAPAAELRVAELRLDQKRKSLLEDAELWTRKIAIENDRRSKVDKSLLEEGKRLQAKQTALAFVWRKREEDAKRKFASEKRERVDRIQQQQQQLKDAREELSDAKKAHHEIESFQMPEPADSSEGHQQCVSLKNVERCSKPKSSNLETVFLLVLGVLALLPAGWANFLWWERDGVGLKILAVAAGIGSVIASVECFLKVTDFRIGRIIYVVLSVGMAVAGLLYEANALQIFCADYIATAAFAALCSALTDNEDRFVGFSLYSDILVLLGVFVTGHWIAGTLMAVLGFVRLAATSAGRSWGIRAMPFIFIVAGIFAWQGCFFWMLGCCVALLGILFHEY